MVCINIDVKLPFHLNGSMWRYGNEGKASGDKGKVRKARSTDLVNKSTQLIANFNDI